MEQEREPTYGDLAAFLRRGLAFATVLAIVAAVTTFVVSGRLEPTYEARASLLVAEPNPELRALAGGVVTPPAVDVSVYGAAATTDSLVADALGRLGRAEPTRAEIRAFVDRLDVRFDETRVSSLVHLDVRSRDPAAAAEEANALADALVAWDNRRAQRSVQRVIETLEAQVRGLEEQIAALQAAGATQREVEERIALREAQRSQLALARAMQTRTIGLLESFDVARPPPRPASPRPLRDTVLAALAGLVLGYALLLLRGAFDGRLRDVEDLERVASAPVLAEFPPQREGQRRLPRESTSYLRTNVQLATVGIHPKVVLVTAADRSTPTFAVSMSLAESFARNGERTLLVDSDLRKSMPRVRTGRDLRGLSLDQPSLREYLEHPDTPLQPTGIDLGPGATLDFIASFDPAPFPSELLSRSFERLLDRFRHHYDVVIVDAAPVLAVADALIVAPAASGIVFAASLAHTTRKRVQQALELLGPVRPRLLGTVAVDVEGARSRALAHTAREHVGERPAEVRARPPQRQRPRQKAGLHHR